MRIHKLTSLSCLILMAGYSNISEAKEYLCKDMSSAITIELDKTAKLTINGDTMFIVTSIRSGKSVYPEEYISNIRVAEIDGVRYLTGIGEDTEFSTFRSIRHFFFVPDKKTLYVDEGPYLDFSKSSVGHNGISKYLCK